MLHSLATEQGSDYRDNDPEVENLGRRATRAMHAGYEYAGAPRAETVTMRVDSTAATNRAAGFYWNALAKGYKLGVQSSSDHISTTHNSYTLDLFAVSADRSDMVESMAQEARLRGHRQHCASISAPDPRSPGKERMMGDTLRERRRHRVSRSRWWGRA